MSRELLERHSAILVAELPGELVFRIVGGYLRIAADPTMAVDGDVLFVDADHSVAHRWIRANSTHNTLLVTEQCDQLCKMCSQPPKKQHVDQFAHLATAALLAPPDVEIGLSGGEPTLHKQELFRFLEAVTRVRPDLSFHVLTNGQHFRMDDLPILRSPQFRKVCWGVPLYASTALLHDEIVGKGGAFETLHQSFSILLQASASIELRTVIVQQNLAALPNLAWYVATHLGFVHTWALMQLENIGFARMRWHELFADHSRDFTPIGTALDIAISRGIRTQLYNCPLCTIPAQYRHLAGRTISDWKQKYVSACAACSARDRCSGFFEWYPERKGFREVKPL